MQEECLFYPELDEFRDNVRLLEDALRDNTVDLNAILKTLQMFDKSKQLLKSIEKNCDNKKQEHQSNATHLKWILGAVKATVVGAIGFMHTQSILLPYRAGNTLLVGLNAIPAATVLGIVLTIAYSDGLFALCNPNSRLSEQEQKEAQKMHNTISKIHEAIAEYNGCIDLLATKTASPVSQYKIDLNRLTSPEMVDSDNNETLSGPGFRR